MRASSLFFALTCCQAAHSAEEYLFRLYVDFPPAQFVSRLFSADVQRGFLLANALLVLLGLVCYIGPVRNQWRSGTAVMWGWTILEALNGLGHSLRSLWESRYTAGTATALPLLGLALFLARRLSAGEPQPNPQPH